MLHRLGMHAVSISTVLALAVLAYATAHGSGLKVTSLIETQAVAAEFHR